MIDYQFTNIIGQRVSIAPGVDTLRFSNNSAAEVQFATAGVTLVVTVGNDTTILDATPQLTDTNPGIFTTSNLLFNDGSAVLVGDLTIDDTLDGEGNTIDLNGNAALTSFLDNNNQILGLAGDDTLSMLNGTGNPIFYGGQGADTITASNGDNIIFGGDTFADTTDGGDTIILGTGNSTVYGNGGDDNVSLGTLTLPGTNTEFFGGLGSDTLTANNSNSTYDVVAGPGDDTVSLQNLQAASTIFGGDGGDAIDLTNSSANVIVYGGDAIADSDDGSDAITLGGGTSTVYANAGGDTVVAGANGGSTATIFLGLGADSLTSSAAAGNYVIYAGPGGDNIDLTNHTGSSTIFGGSGIADPNDTGDTITGSSGGSDLIYGNGGGDVITVRPGAGQTATVFAGAGNDTVAAAPTSNDATYSLHGNTDNDVFQLDFGTSRARITIEDYSLGDNSLEVTLSGGAAASALTLTRDATQTRLRNGNEEDIVLSGYTGNFTDQTASFSDNSVLITNFNEAAASFTGSAAGDLFFAGSNGDTISAAAGNDQLNGGSGDDQFGFLTADLTSGDTVNGGDGNDTLSIGTPGTAIVDNVFDNVSNVEMVILESGDYSVNSVALGNNAATAGIRTVDGSATNGLTLDLTGMGFGVNATGGSGDDSISASPNDDTMVGGSGNDTIFGNRGDDTLTGGDGNDVFVYNEGIIENTDTITDIDFDTDGTVVDRIQITSGAANFNLGNQDITVDGAILNSVTAAGALGTEVIILRDVSIATNDINASLDTINANALASRGVLNVFHDSQEGNVVIYYDTNGQTSGGHVKLASLSNLTDVSDMDNIDFTDFVFV